MPTINPLRLELKIKHKMPNDKLRLGLPKGSLNSQGRADTNSLLTIAGLEPKGYIPGKEDEQSLALNDINIRPFLARPQSAAMELSLGYLDAAL